MFLYIALFLGSFARKVILGIYGLFSADRNTRVCHVCVSVCACVCTCMHVCVCTVVFYCVIMSYLVLCTVMVCAVHYIKFDVCKVCDKVP